MITRRRFLHGVSSVVAITVVGFKGQANAQAAKVDEADPQAMALGYKHDTGTVDKAKYPKHDASQKCSTCQFFQGKADDAWGGCPLFPGKEVSSNGWCSSYVKKA